MRVDFFVKRFRFIDRKSVLDGIDYASWIRGLFDMYSSDQIELIINELMNELPHYLKYESVEDLMDDLVEKIGLDPLSEKNIFMDSGLLFKEIVNNYSWSIRHEKEKSTVKVKPKAGDVISEDGSLTPNMICALLFEIASYFFASKVHKSKKLRKKLGVKRKIIISDGVKGALYFSIISSFFVAGMSIEAGRWYEESAFMFFALALFYYPICVLSLAPMGVEDYLEKTRHREKQPGLLLISSLIFVTIIFSWVMPVYLLFNYYEVVMDYFCNLDTSCVKLKSS